MKSTGRQQQFVNLHVLWQISINCDWLVVVLLWCSFLFLWAVYSHKSWDWPKVTPATLTALKIIQMCLVVQLFIISQDLFAALHELLLLQTEAASLSLTADCVCLLTPSFSVLVGRLPTDAPPQREARPRGGVWVPAVHLSVSRGHLQVARLARGRHATPNARAQVHHHAAGQYWHSHTAQTLLPSSCPPAHRSKTHKKVLIRIFGRCVMSQKSLIDLWGWWQHL